MIFQYFGVHLSYQNNKTMIQVKKIRINDVIEFVTKHSNLVSSINGWILCNPDGSFYSHPIEGYQIFYNKETAMMAATYLNNYKI